MSSVDQIKSKIDIVSLVGSYVKLDKAGNNWKGKCPFHNEKTPSFFVSPDRGGYYCFGCHAKGDIFTFVEQFEGLDFVGALKVLADKAGVTLERYDKGEKSEKDKFHSILEQAVFFYEKKLTETPAALEYLKKRGVSDATIKDFRIGFAPAEWRELYDYLSERNVSEKDMLAVGLIKPNQSGRPYDTFRGRIMFPINDSAGRPVGFSGRILVDDGKSAKYLNSPETALFNKSEILFGLDKAKKNIRIKDYSILVEGQMDLVMMHQVDIANTVASSGTALTENHLIKLRRLSNRIIMAYDGDVAGFLASNRSAKLALALGMELKIAQMPPGKDPADAAKEDPEALKKILRGSKHIIDFYTDTLLSRKFPARELGLKVQKEVLPYVALLGSAIEKSHFIKTIAEKTDIREEALWDDLHSIKSSAASTSGGAPPKVEKKEEAVERNIFGMFFRGLVSEGQIKKIIGKQFEVLRKKFEKDKEALLFEAEKEYDEEHIERDTKELLSSLEEKYLKKAYKAAQGKLQKAEGIRNEKEIEKYLKMCRSISRRLNAIKIKIV